MNQVIITKDLNYVNDDFLKETREKILRISRMMKALRNSTIKPLNLTSKPLNPLTVKLLKLPKLLKPSKR